MLGAARTIVIAALVLAIGLIAGLGAYVSHTQSQARGVLRDELGQRAGFTGRLLSGALMTSASPEALKAFGGPRSTLPALAAQARAWRRAPTRGLRRAPARDRGVESGARPRPHRPSGPARGGGAAGPADDLRRPLLDGIPVIGVTVPVPAKDGRRVLATRPRRPR